MTGAIVHFENSHITEILLTFQELYRDRKLYDVHRDHI